MNQFEHLGRAGNAITGFYTTRLSVRPLSTSDTPTIFRSIREESSKYTHYNRNSTQAQLESSINRILNKKSTFKEEFYYVLTHRDSSVFIGLLSFTDITGNCTCHIFIDAYRRSNGYAEEIIQGSFPILSGLDVRELFFDVDPDSVPSVKIMESLGGVRSPGDPTIKQFGDGSEGAVVEYILPIK